MRRKGFTLLKGLLLSAVTIGIALVLYPTVCYLPDRSDRMPCQANLKQIALALRQYGADNDGRFPSLQTVAGWRDGVSDYAKNEAIFQCPGADGDRAARRLDYWFNARLSGARQADLAVASLTVSLGDGYPTTDPHASLPQLPKSWLSDPKSPAKRHLDGLNVAFPDGHVKWLRPDKITDQAPDENAYGFAIR